MIYENDSADIATDLYSFYFMNGAYGLMSSSPVTRTKCVTILSYLSKASVEPIIPLLSKLETYSNDVYWELKGQVLILCSNMLMQFNSEGDEEDGDNLSAAGEGPALLDQNEDGEVQEVHPESPKEPEKEGSQIQEEPEEEESKIEEEKEEAEPQEEEPVEENSPPSNDIKEQPTQEEAQDTQNMSKVETMQKLSEEYSPLLFNIINKIFLPQAPKATLKIGLIYLAKILHFYEDFSDQYLKILLSVPDAIRTSVVDCNPIPGTEEEVLVAGATTEKYRTYGAPLEWNPIFIASSLEKYIKTNNLENLEWAHIEIFESCLQQNFYEGTYEKWLSIFSSLKSYFFISLCDRDFCRTSIEILKKIYLNESMQEAFIKESKEIFVKTLKLLYQPDVEQECKDNVKEFLELLHNCDESTPALQKMVYDVIKYFAEKNTAKYQTSNLIELTNDVVYKKRGEIFPAKIQSHTS